MYQKLLNIKDKLSADSKQNLVQILTSILKITESNLICYINSIDNVLLDFSNKNIKHYNTQDISVEVLSKLSEIKEVTFELGGGLSVFLSKKLNIKKNDFNSVVIIPSLDQNQNCNYTLVFFESEKSYTEKDAMMFRFFSALIQNEENQLVLDRCEKETLKKYSALLKYSSAGLFILKDMKVVDFNEVGVKMLGMVTDKISGDNFFDVIKNEEVRRLFEQALAETTSGITKVFELDNKVLKNSTFLEVKMDKVILDNQELVLIGVHDISKRKNYEQELVKAKNRAEEQNRLKSNSLASLSHELRTPLNSIIGFSELLLDEDSDDEEKEMFSKLIQNAGRSLMNLIDDIIDISKIEAGQVSIKRSSFNVNTFLEDLLVIFKQDKSQRDKNHIELRLVLSDKLSDVEIESDRHRLQQVFSNLLTNSLKFIDDGYIEFGYSTVMPDYIQFYVKDTGVGINLNDRSRVFEAYGQDKKLYTRNKKGTGLGLAISKSFVELLGGKIWLDSEVEAGTTFYFTIPVNLDPDSPYVDISSESLGLKNWSGRKVLVVDDVKENFVFIRGLLKDTGVDIAWAKNGKEAVEICRIKKYDIVLMDVRMPVMDGYEATSALKDLTPDITIIAQTAFASPEEEKQCLSKGFDNFISKPIESDKLISVIEYYLD